MKQYITKKGQNIFDVCLMLYGSVEGILDLMVNNETMTVTEYGPQHLAGQPLTLDTVLDRGVVLNYSEGLNINQGALEFYRRDDVTVANGECPFISVYEYDRSSVRIVIHQRGEYVDFDIAPQSHTLYVDWGDYSDIADVSEGVATLEHVYNDDGDHVIQIFGDFVALAYLDFSRITGTVYPTSSIPITGEGHLNNYNADLIALFPGIYPGEHFWFRLDETPLDDKYRLIS